MDTCFLTTLKLLFYCHIQYVEKEHKAVHLYEKEGK